MKDNVSIHNIVGKLTGAYSIKEEQPVVDVDPLEEEIQRIREERALEKTRPVSLRRRDRINEVFNNTIGQGKFVDKTLSKITSPNENRVFFVKISVSAPDINKQMYTAIKAAQDVKKVIPYRLTGTGIELGVVATRPDEVAYVLREFISSIGFERGYYYLDRVLDPAKL
jgi:hypothetical protein